MKVNQVLTQYAQGIAVDMNRSDNALQFAYFLAPELVVGGAVGQFKKFDNKDAFQVVETSRPVGGGAKRLEFQDSDGYFNCKPQALEITIDQHERDQAGSGDLLGLQRAKVSNLVTTAGLSFTKRVIDKAKTVAAVGSVGNWTNASVDPISEIDSILEDMANKTNRMPDRIALGLSTWRILRSHPKILSRFSGLSAAVSEEQFLGLLMYSNLKLKIGSFGYDTKKSGAAKNMTNMVGAEFFMFHASDTPSQYDPSFMKTFRTALGGVTQVREYKTQDERQDVYSVDWTEDIQVVGAESVRRITVT